MKSTKLVTIVTVSATIALMAVAAAATETGANPDDALQQLTAGNQRFAGAHMTHPHESADRRAELANAQHPFAVVISCSDSRVSPEIVFDEGIGDLFVIRTAGNRLDDIVLASVEYAVEHLGTNLIVVLGHERCGAVTAAIEASKHGSQGGHAAAHSHVPVLMHIMQDAVKKAKDEPGDRVDNTVVENVRIVTAGLPQKSQLVAERMKAGTLKVVGMRYDLDTGVVTPVEAPAPSGGAYK
ncbi:MAG TPA: carbonic anhydrase [Candidatus Krumholzibacteria bacterium]|nr:carbonic anhydrase [Candidatus Krumholzibacteria bacterium]